MRLTFWYAGVLALALILFGVLTYLLFSYTLQNQTNETLNEIATVFETTAKREFDDENKITDSRKMDEAIRDAATELGFKDYQIFAFGKNNKLVAATKVSETDTHISNELAEAKIKEFFANATINFADFETGEKSFRSLIYSFNLQNQNYRILITHPLDDQEELLAKIGYAFFISIPLVLLLAGFGGYFLAKKSLSPINEMSRKAEEITAKNLHERLPVKNENDELGILAGKFNELLARLDESFERQRRFMADASHELRTPVVIVRGEADVTLGKEKRSETEYREALAIIQSEGERMTHIIEDLFTLARADAGQMPLQKSDFYLDDLLAETVKAYRSLADQRGIAIELKAIEEMPVNADQHLLKRLFSNLIDNALKYSKSHIKINAENNGENYQITIADDGLGIPLLDQPHIFERFYRADKARSRQNNRSATSGAGLGLSICKFIAEAHGGKIELISSNNQKGTVFQVSFPAKENNT